MSWYHHWFGGTPKSTTTTTQDRAEQGNAEAQFNLGLQYAGEQAPNYLQAAQWYHKAAAQNHILAQFNLGIMYAAGQGLPRDGAQAAAWFLKAAQQGDAGAQYRLGFGCQRASFEALPGVALESRIEAFKWYQLAAAQGYRDSAKACDSITMSMTRADVTEGQHRAASFVVTAPKPLAPAPTA